MSKSLILGLFLLFPILAHADPIDWEKLVNAIIVCESGENPNAYNEKTHAFGLCQITPIVLKEFAIEQIDPFDRIIMSYDENSWILFSPIFNKKVGTWYLHRLHDHYLKDIVIMQGVEDKNSFLVFPYKENEGQETYSSRAKKAPLIRISYVKTIEDIKIVLILTSYNWGIENVKKVNYDYNKFPKSVKIYIRKVLAIYNKNDSAW